MVHRSNARSEPWDEPQHAVGSHVLRTLLAQAVWRAAHLGLPHTTWRSDCVAARHLVDTRSCDSAGGECGAALPQDANRGIVVLQSCCRNHG